MDEKGPDRGKAVPSLAAALRSARAEAAERSQAVTNLRGAEIGRLELLREALQPVFAQVPEDVDLFDTGIVPGEHPRLFIDMIAFVDMARDRRAYRFHLDTRHGRVLIGETEDIDAMTAKITDYIAHRLIEREAALSSVSSDDFPSTPQPQASRQPLIDPPPPAVPPAPPARKPTSDTAMARAVRLAIQGFGVLALLWFGLHIVQGRLPSW